jgi:hypothetical protein
MAVLLAANRCLELAIPSLARRLFNGPRMCLWLWLSLGYSLAIGLFHKPLLFNGLYFSWFFNPHAGYLDDPERIVSFQLFYENYNFVFETTFFDI